MRTLFFLLVAVNLGYFAWQYGAGGLADPSAPAAAPPQPIPEGVVKLVPLDKHQPGHAPPDARGAGDAAVTPPEHAAAEKTPAAATTASDDPPPDAPAATVQAENQPASPGPRPAPRRPPPAAPAADTEPSSAGQAVCWLVGRFADESLARAAVAVFQDKGLDADFSMRERQRVHYWVHTPVQPSHAAANGMIDELNAKGIRDVAVVQTGDWKDSVSLGYYSSEPIARHRLEQVRRLGVEADIQTDAQSVMTYWMRYRDAPGADAAWRGLAAAQPKLGREKAPSCR